MRRLLRAGMAMALLGAVAVSASAAQAEERVVRLYAAGSLKQAMTELGRAFTAAHGIKVEATFGASGLLRQQLEKSGAGDVYASADMGNPEALAEQGKAWPVALFARNRLCAIVRPGLTVTPGTLLSTMLEPGVKLGTSTPDNDPAGDYAWQLFAKADLVQPGAGAVLKGKALKLTGSPDAGRPPEGRSVYAWNVSEGRADIFLAYCTAAKAAAAEMPGLGVVEVPPDMAVGAEYGLTALKAADARTALPFILYVLSGDGQAILAHYGFDAPMKPARRWVTVRPATYPN